MSVVFDFNDSHNDIAPLSLILLSVDVKRNGESELLMSVICVNSFFSTNNTDRVE